METIKIEIDTTSAQASVDSIKNALTELQFALALSVLTWLFGSQAIAEIDTERNAPWPNMDGEW